MDWTAWLALFTPEAVVYTLVGAFLTGLAAGAAAVALTAWQGRG